MKTLIVLLFFAANSAQGATVRSYLRNREGVHKFADKSYYPAYQSFLSALQEDPLNPEIQMNLGRTFEANEEYEKAEHAYKGALKILPEDSPRRFEALFNLGGALGKEKKIDEALTAYQAALEMTPDSKEVKTNIELLLQGGGGGGGQGEEQKDQKDKDGKNQQQSGNDNKKDQKNQDPQDQKDQKKQPKPFQSQDLSQQDVKKILDEIKNQEQAIRAQEYERNAKEAPRGKDW